MHELAGAPPEVNAVQPQVDAVAGSARVRQRGPQAERVLGQLKQGWARVCLGRREHGWEIDSPGAPFLPHGTPAVLSVERDGVREHFEIPVAENGVRRVLVVEAK